MNISLSIGPVIALIAGILILIVPRLLNYIVAFMMNSLREWAISARHARTGMILRRRRPGSSMQMQGPGAEQAHEADQDQIEGDDIVQQARDNQNEYARDQRNHRTNA